MCSPGSPSRPNHACQNILHLFGPLDFQVVAYYLHKIPQFTFCLASKWFPPDCGVGLAKCSTKSPMQKLSHIEIRHHLLDSGDLKIIFSADSNFRRFIS